MPKKAIIKPRPISPELSAHQRARLVRLTPLPNELKQTLLDNPYLQSQHPRRLLAQLDVLRDLHNDPTLWRPGDNRPALLANAWKAYPLQSPWTIHPQTGKPVRQSKNPQHPPTALRSYILRYIQNTHRQADLPLIQAQRALEREQQRKTKTENRTLRKDIRQHQLERILRLTQTTPEMRQRLRKDPQFNRYKPKRLLAQLDALRHVIRAQPYRTPDQLAHIWMTRMHGYSPYPPRDSRRPSKTQNPLASYLAQYALRHHHFQASPEFTDRDLRQTRRQRILKLTGLPPKQQAILAQDPRFYNMSSRRALASLDVARTLHQDPTLRQHEPDDEKRGILIAKAILNKANLHRPYAYNPQNPNQKSRPSQQPTWRQPDLPQVVKKSILQGKIKPRLKPYKPRKSRRT